MNRKQKNIHIKNHTSSYYNQGVETSDKEKLLKAVREQKDIIMNRGNKVKGIAKVSCV